MYCIPLYLHLMLHSGGTIYYDDVWMSNNLGASWQLSTGNAGWAARRGTAAVSIGGTIIFMGGASGGEYVYM